LSIEEKELERFLKEGVQSLLYSEVEQFGVLAGLIELFGASETRKKAQQCVFWVKVGGSNPPLAIFF
jgi:hypothetical protein